MGKRILTRRSVAVGTCLTLVAVVVILALGRGPLGPRLTEEQAVAIALPAMNADMTPEHVNRYTPYRAELRAGVWHVFGTVPGGGAGGTPEAKVRDRDGKVLDVFHSQ